MNENAAARPSMPRWIVPVLTVTIVIVLFQSLFILAIGDAGVIAQAKAAAKAERDVKGAASYFNSRSNEEIDQLVTDRKDAVIGALRKEKMKPVIVKVVLAVLLAFITVGVRAGKPNPARPLAMIAGILMLFSLVVNFANIKTSLAVYKYLDSKWIVILDLAWYVFAVLSAAACFVAFAKLKPSPVRKADPGAPRPIGQ